MKRRFKIIGLIIFCSISCFSQLVSTKEAFPNGNADLTIIVDLKLATDPRTKSLLGKTSDIYFWSGAGDELNGNAFKYTPSNQTNFNAPYEPGKMISLGNDKWSVTIYPRKYYKVPDNVVVKKIGLVIKNGTGNAQTEDIFLELFDGSLNMKIIEPKMFPFMAKEGDSISLKIIFSEKVACRILVKTNISIGLEKGLIIGNFYKKEIDSVDTSFKLFTLSQNIKGTKLDLEIEIEKNGKMLKVVKEIFVQPDVNLVEIPQKTKNGLNYISDNELIISFFAPEKKFIYLLGDINNWQINSEYLFKKDPNSDTFWIKLENLEAGKEYAYQFLVDGTIQVADPFGEKILDPNYDKNISDSVYPNLKAYPSQANGIVSILQTNQKPYEWKAANFSRPKSEQLIVYELHIRDFTVEGTFKAAYSRIPYLKNLGINAIELMPVSEFTGNDSWGYNPTFYQAIDKAYGTKDDLKNFIDECHKNGIAVIIDMVLNQADEAFPYVQMYKDGVNIAKDSPYFNVTATHPFSVFRDFNHESKATQQLVDQVNKYWLEEFKIDGFRFDLSKGFTQTVNIDVQKWSAYDGSRVKIWKRIYDKIRETDKTAYVILEHFAANNEEQELADYGMMFWGNGNGNYRANLKGETSDLAGLSYKVRAWNKPNLIGYMESHDEERLMFDLQKSGLSSGNYSSKNLYTAIERAKAAAAIFFLTQGPKMIWQFGELGYDISIDQNGRTGKKPIKWEYFDEPNRKKLYQTYSELIKLKAILETVDAKFNYQLSGKFKQTKIENTNLKALVLANFSLENRVETLDAEAGSWFDYFTGKEFTVVSNEKLSLLPGEFHIYTNKKLNNPATGIVPWEAFTKEQILSEEKGSVLPLSIFPNPSLDKIVVNFSVSMANNYNLEILNLAGNNVHKISRKASQNIVNEVIDIKKIPSGIYFLRVISEGKLQSGKFLKQ